MSQPVVPPMPTPRDRGAPAFDPSKPWELRHFFEELKFHFRQSNVVDEATMKKHALQFADCDTVELWEILPEFADTAKMYQDFVDAVYKLYPGFDSERWWVIADMDKLVGETSWVGILSLVDLGKYHREFMAIMTFLIVKNHILPTKQSCVFVCGFPLEIWNRVAHHLQLKLPDHFPNNPYTLEEIHDTVCFVLHGTALYALVYNDQRQAAQTSTAVTKVEPTIKTEDFTTLLDVMKQVVSKMGNQGNQSKPSPPRDLHCHFCSGGHFKNSCNILKEYIWDGKCILCNDGHIALLGRHFIPGMIAGKTFKDHLDEWLWQNPDPTPTPTTNSLLLDVFPNPITASFQLMADDCIHSLEKELFALCSRQEKGIHMWAQKAHEPETGKEALSECKVSKPLSTPQQSEVPITKEVTNDVNQPPTHPFVKAKDMTYSPPSSDNVAVKLKPPPVKKPEVMYRTSALISDPQVASDIYSWTMNSQITLTQCKLLSLLPEVRSQVCEATSNWWVPQVSMQTAPTNQDFVDAITSIEPEDEERDRAWCEVTRFDAMPAAYQSAVYCSTFDNQTCTYGNTEPLPGSTIIKDPYEVFLSTTPVGRHPNLLTVAKESFSLCSILLLINHHLFIESILDPGSQVISMAKEACHSLGLIYDLEVKLSMQSANGKIDKTLGLVHNVPIQIGEIMLYLQFHIVQNPVYDILLGRPFDVLVESIVCNFENESQMVTIHDLNTGKTAMVPTFMHRMHLCTCHPSPDFCDLRIWSAIKEMSH